jgi:hypothetical protein
LSSPCIPSLILCITCLVPALYPLLSCIPCLGSAPQYILCAYSVHSFQVCITSTSILALLRCTCFVIARQILSTPCRHSGQNPHRPSRTLRPTDRNNLRAACVPAPVLVALPIAHPSAFGGCTDGGASIAPACAPLLVHACVCALLSVTPTPDILDCARQTGEGPARQRACVVPLIRRAPCFVRTRREGGENGGGAVSAPHSLGREGTAGEGGAVSHVASTPMPSQCKHRSEGGKGGATPFVCSACVHGVQKAGVVRCARISVPCWGVGVLRSPCSV